MADAGLRQEDGLQNAGEPHFWGNLRTIWVSDGLEFPVRLNTENTVFKDSFRNYFSCHAGGPEKHSCNYFVELV